MVKGASFFQFVQVGGKFQFVLVDSNFPLLIGSGLSLLSQALCPDFLPDCQPLLIYSDLKTYEMQSQQASIELLHQQQQKDPTPIVNPLFHITHGDSPSLIKP